MQEIVISAATLTKADDFYVAFLTAVGAPAWHGHNLDAVWDSLRGGDINRVNAPYRLRIIATRDIPEDCRQLIDRFAELLREARTKGIAVELVCEP